MNSFCAVRNSLWLFQSKAFPLRYNVINKITINRDQKKLQLTIITNNLQQHVSALKSHLQAEYKGVYIIQSHIMEDS